MSSQGAKQPRRGAVLQRLGQVVRLWNPNPAQGEDEGYREQVTPPSPPPEGVLAWLEQALEDIEAVLRHDPAARHALEVVLVYPGLHALWSHRLAHGMWRRGWVTGPRVLSHLTRWVTGVEIHPGARVGRGVFIDHGMGVVIGETATVGDGCLLYQGVVLGGTSLERKRRHPTLGRGVVVGTNASILGALHVGDGARVGSGSVVIRDVPAGATVVGVPGRVVERRGSRALLDHASLPDPVAAVLESLIDEVERLRAEVEKIRGTAAGASSGGGAGTSKAGSLGDGPSVTSVTQLEDVSGGNSCDS